MLSLIDLDGEFFVGLEFCIKSYALLDMIKNEPDGRNRLLLRSGKTEKRLMDEILPICRYIQTYYRPGRYISVCWKAGSQQYDAELSQFGEYIDLGFFPKLAYLEITGAMHVNEHWTRKLLAKGEIVYAPEGIDAIVGTPLKSDPVVFTNQEHVYNFASIVVSSIKNKSEKKYPLETSIIVQCHLNNLYTADQWQLLVSEVEQQLNVTRFRQVLLLNMVTQNITELNINYASVS